MARALLLEPEVLFLDEPTASVDMRNTSIIEDIVLSSRTNRSLAVMTTNDERQAERGRATRFSRWMRAC